MTFGHPVWFVLTLTLTFACGAWAVCGSQIWFRRLAAGPPAPAVIRAIYHEVKPAYLPLLVGAHVTNLLWVRQFRWSDLVATAVGAAIYWWLRNVDTDDRWKRRARALGQLVVRSVHRLRVVPATAGAGA